MLSWNAPLTPPPNGLAPLCKLYRSLIDGFETSEPQIRTTFSAPLPSVFHIKWRTFMITMVCRWRPRRAPLLFASCVSVRCCVAVCSERPPKDVGTKERYVV